MAANPILSFAQTPAAPEIIRQPVGGDAANGDTAEFRAVLQRSLEANDTTDGGDPTSAVAIDSSAKAASPADNSAARLWSMVAAYRANSHSIGAAPATVAAADCSNAMAGELDIDSAPAWNSPWVGANPASATPEAEEAAERATRDSGLLAASIPRAASTLPVQGTAAPATAADSAVSAAPAGAGNTESPSQSGNTQVPSTPRGKAPKPATPLADSAIPDAAKAEATHSLEIAVGQVSGREELEKRISTPNSTANAAEQPKLDSARLNPMEINIKADGKGESTQFTTRKPGTDAKKASASDFQAALRGTMEAEGIPATGIPPSLTPSGVAATASASEDSSGLSRPMSADPIAETAEIKPDPARPGSPDLGVKAEDDGAAVLFAAKWRGGDTADFPAASQPTAATKATPAGSELPVPIPAFRATTVIQLGDSTPLPRTSVTENPANPNSATTVASGSNPAGTSNQVLGESGVNSTPDFSIPMDTSSGDSVPEAAAGGVIASRSSAPPADPLPRTALATATAKAANSVELAELETAVGAGKADTPNPSGKTEASQVDRGLSPAMAVPLADPISPAMAQASIAPKVDVNQVLETPVGHGPWREELGERILMLADRNSGTARFKLNPAHLGPLDVSIKVDGDGASIQFTSQNAGVREALEAAVPKLREMLGVQHIPLNEVVVLSPTQAVPADGRNQGFDFHRQPGSAAGSALPGLGSKVGDSSEEMSTEPGRSSAASGLVNFFA